MATNGNIRMDSTSCYNAAKEWWVCEEWLRVGKGVQRKGWAFGFHPHCNLTTPNWGMQICMAWLVSYFLLLLSVMLVCLTHFEWCHAFLDSNGFGKWCDAEADSLQLCSNTNSFHRSLLAENLRSHPPSPKSGGGNKQLLLIAVTPPWKVVQSPRAKMCTCFSRALFLFLYLVYI